MAVGPKLEGDGGGEKEGGVGGRRRTFVPDGAEVPVVRTRSKEATLSEA
jgi:hypothetical protein